MLIIFIAMRRIAYQNIHTGRVFFDMDKIS